MDGVRPTRRRALALVGGLAAAGWSPARAAVSAADADPAVARALKALAPNEAVALGAARVVGEFNETARRFGLDRSGPRGRDYTLKMVWAPERRRALFAGANHGSPHRLNDVWEFDLAALRWILLYAPDLPRNYAGLGEDSSDVEFRDGLLLTRRGGPAVIAHTWWGLTYDPVQRQMLFMNTWVTDQAAAVRRLGGDPAALYKGAPLWAFSPSEGRWSALKAPPPTPPAPFAAMLEHVPALGGSIWHMNNWQMRATWLFDAQRNRWTNLRANADSGDFHAQAPGAELVGYHDPGRGLVVAQRGRNTYHFDVARRRWSKVIAAEADSDAVPDGHDARTPFYFDQRSGHGLLIELRARVLWAYDPDRVRWTRLQPAGSPMPTGQRLLAYADAAHNVLVVVDGTAVWAYRYRAG